MLHEEESERELTLYKVLSVSMPTHHRVSRSYKAVVLSPLASVQHSLEEGEGRERGRRDGERGREREGRGDGERGREREGRGDEEEMERGGRGDGRMRERRRGRRKRKEGEKKRERGGWE